LDEREKPWKEAGKRKNLGQNWEKKRAFCVGNDPGGFPLVHSKAYKILNRGRGKG